MKVSDDIGHATRRVSRWMRINHQPTNSGIKSIGYDSEIGFILQIPLSTVTSIRFVPSNSDSCGELQRRLLSSLNRRPNCKGPHTTGNRGQNC